MSVSSSDSGFDALSVTAVGDEHNDAVHGGTLARL
jgi:hypothetical protein